MTEKEVRLIDAMKYRKILEEEKEYATEYATNEERIIGLDIAIADLGDMPTIEAYTEQDVRDAYNDGYSTGMEQGREKAEVHGRWKQNSRGNTYCSECFGETGTQYKYDYCPNCGAKMDLKDED